MLIRYVEMKIVIKAKNQNVRKWGNYMENVCFSDPHNQSLGTARGRSDTVAYAGIDFSESEVIETKL